MLNVSPAVNQNVEYEEHNVRLGTGILDGIETRVTSLIKRDQFTIDGGPQWQSFLEGGADLRKPVGKVLPVFR
jgi:hypothetical protein